MTDEVKELINLQLQVLRNTLIENGLSMYLDAEGKYIGFFDTDTYLKTKKISGVKVSIDSLVK